MYNVLVVGGAGYVGGIIVDLLREDGAIKDLPRYEKIHVTVYDKLLYEDSYRKNVDFVYGDVRDKEKLLPLLNQADAVIWLAALVGDGACQINPQLTKEINTDTVEWLSKKYNGRIVFTSTCSVYGAQAEDPEEDLDEWSPVDPLSVYAISKLDAEQHLKDKNAIIYRLGTLFGVGDLFSRIRLDLVVNILTVKAKTEGKITVFNGGQYRPLLHVKDVAKTIVDNLNCDETGIFNIHNENISISSLAHQVKEHFPEIEIEYTDMYFQDARNYRVSSDKAKQYLKFNPTCSINQGIEELKYLVETKRIKNLNDKRYSNQAFLNGLDINQI